MTKINLGESVYILNKKEAQLLINYFNDISPDVLDTKEELVKLLDKIEYLLNE